MSAEVDFNAEALLAAQRATEIGLTQKAISEALGASQSQISRVLSGHSRRRSKLLARTCEYVFSQSASGSPQPQDSAALMAALAATWDGSPQHADALALVIRSLGSLTPVRERQRTTRTAKP